MNNFGNKLKFNKTEDIKLQRRRQMTTNDMGNGRGGNLGCGKKAH